MCCLRPRRLRLFLTQQCTQSLTDANAAHLQRQPGTAGHNPDRRTDTFLSESLINMPLGGARGDPVNLRQREDHQGVIPRGHERWTEGHGDICWPGVPPGCGGRLRLPQEGPLSLAPAGRPAGLTHRYRTCDPWESRMLCSRRRLYVILLEVYFLYKSTCTFMLLLNVREPALPREPPAEHGGRRRAAFRFLTRGRWVTTGS